MKRLLSLATAAVLILFATTVYAASDEPVQDEALTIRNSNGEHLGTIRNFLLDSSGNIVFVILSYNGTGHEQKDIAVPLTAFSFNHEKDQVVLNVSSEQLDAAPEFTVSELSDPSFPGRVYQFFGVAPSWPNPTEDGPEIQ